MPTVIDEHSRQCLAIRTERKLDHGAVLETLLSSSGAGVSATTRTGHTVHLVIDHRHHKSKHLKPTGLSR
jgi:hypothetical protein